METQINELISGYTIVKALGNQKQRKFSSVYLLKEKTTGGLAVLKTAHVNRHGALAVERLRHESRFTFSVPFLPTLRFQQCSEEEVILLFDYIDAPNLNAFDIPEKWKDRVDFTFHFLERIEPTFQSLHESNILHLDVKPSNFLIGDHSVHVLDFGMAHQLGAPWNRSTLFALGFSAPELILNEIDCLNYKTDYFSIGILTYWMLEGQIPLLHPNPSITTNLQLVHPLPKGNQIPKQMTEVLSKMATKFPFKRPPNQLSKDERILGLKHAQSLRFDSLNEFTNALKEAYSVPKWKFWK